MLFEKFKSFLRNEARWYEYKFYAITIFSC